MKLSTLIIILLLGFIAFRLMSDSAKREEEKQAKLEAAMLERKKLELEQLAIRQQEEQFRREEIAREQLARALATPPPTPKPDWRWTSDPLRGHTTGADGR